MHHSLEKVKSIFLGCCCEVACTHFCVGIIPWLWFFTGTKHLSCSVFFFFFLGLSVTLPVRALRSFFLMICTVGDEVYSSSLFSAKQFFSVFHKYSRGKKSICESNSLRGLRQMKMLFFLNPPHLTQEVFACFLLLLLSLSLSTYLSFSFFTFDLNSDIQVCPRMSVTNCSPTL